MKNNLIHYRTSVCNINYHVVWSVKYRRKILTADEKGFTVQMFECGECDHVHCFITAPPKLSVTVIVKYLKGITGRKL
ncbi:MAG: IS200/IS605 family transposase, partial [Eubacterium sp.]|nr:IS200/IS605 family transposase [Eubacterium sp.]